MTGAIAAGQYSIAAVVSVTVQLHDQNIYKRSISLSAATAVYAVNSSGAVIGTPGGTLETWLTGTGASSSNYEVMATQSAGVTVSGSLGAWLNCGSNNSWALSNAARDNSVLTGVIAVQIRDVATHTVRASASITLSAESGGSGGGGDL